ncbi:MAG: peroxiredoxin [Gammaproteobacteria bacterium]|nr:peroxiredoxin [Gammaproteobacteria bacterium]
MRTFGILLATAALCLALAFQACRSAETISEGGAAPSFRLQDQNGAWHTLEDYKGKWVVLYFYPKDDTPGCTTEACNFRDDIFAFRKLGVAILGVSTDDVESHQQFAEKHSLPFSLLSDPKGETTEQYGSLRNLGVLKYAQRHSFLINPDGVIAKYYEEVDPDTHSAQIMTDLQGLM